MSIDEVSRLREIFIVEYCKKKNWNINKLTTSQNLEIATNAEYIYHLISNNS